MRAHAFVTTTALACVLLAGCTDDPVGPVDDASAPTTSASPTPTGPTPPPLPDAAQADTTAGAVAFVEHYIELLNYAANTGDVAPLRSASSDCEGCSRYADYYERVYANGGYFRDGAWKPVGPIADGTPASMIVLVDAEAPRRPFKEKATDEEKIASGATYKLRFELVANGGGWTAKRLTEQNLDGAS